MGGFSAPSESAGSKPWPIIRVEGFSLRPPISITSGLGRRRAVAPVSSFSSAMSRLPSANRERCVETEPAASGQAQGRLGGAAQG